MTCDNAFRRLNEPRFSLGLHLCSPSVWPARCELILSMGIQDTGVCVVAHAQNDAADTLASGHPCPSAQADRVD